MHEVGIRKPARRPRLRTLLLAVNLVILLLPLGGIAILRIYESALVRQTESELIAQSAFIAASYRAAFNRLGPEFGRPLHRLDDYGLPAPPAAAGRWQPRPARLDLADDRALPPRPDPQPTRLSPDPLAQAIGRELSPVLREAQRVTLAGIRVVDYRGLVVASTGYDGGRSLAHLLEVGGALAGRAVSLLRLRDPERGPPPLDSISRGGNIRAVVAAPIVVRGRVVAAVVAARTPNNIVRALYGKRYLLLQSALALLAAVALLTLFTSLTISRPLGALMRQARRAERGEIGAVTPLRRPVTAEVAELSQTVAAMAAALERRADYIRGFAAHVSHEFKTPLAAMKGALELLQDHYETMPGTDRERFLGNLQNDVARLERLVRRLLELARADVLSAAAEPADLAALLRELADRPNVTLRADRDSGIDIDLPLPVALDADTLRAVFDNLFDNARQHAGANARVTLAVGRAAGAYTVDVGDSGPGVSTANAGRIFEPFFTTSRARGGTGLGLAIVSALLRAYRADIELLSNGGADRGGAVFRLRLPAAG